MTREPQAAYLGLGQIFCVLVLDWRPIWSRHAPGTLPVRTSDAHELLVLRWCSIPAELDAAPTVLTRVAETAPSPDADLDTLAAWRKSLPPGVQLTVLRASALIGPWADRPGQSLHAQRPHRAA